MKVLHLLSKGGLGGIESLVRDFSEVSKLNNYYCFIYEGGENATAIKQNGSHVDILNCQERSFTTTLLIVIKEVRKIRPNVVVIHNTSPMLRMIAYAIKKLLHVKTIVYSHSNARTQLLESTSLKNRCLNYMTKKGIETADAVIAISKSVLDSCIDVYNISKNNIVVLYNGVKLSKFSPIKVSVFNRKNIIYVGRLIDGKGVQNIISVLSQIDFDFTFTVVGDGPYAHELAEQAREFGIEDKVFFLGGRTDVQDLLEKADIFIHVPDLEEGFGVTIIEAMAAGKLCICNKKGAIPEIITNNVDGILVNSKEELSNTLKSIFFDEMNTSEINRIRLNAKKRANDFSIEQYVYKLEEVINKL